MASVDIGGVDDFFSLDGAVSDGSVADNDDSGVGTGCAITNDASADAGVSEEAEGIFHDTTRTRIFHPARTRLPDKTRRELRWTDKDTRSTYEQDCIVLYLRMR